MRSLFYEFDKLIKEKKLTINIIANEKRNRLSKNYNDYGAVDKISPIDIYDLEKLIEDTMKSNKIPLFLVLDQLSDVRDFGAF